MVEDIKKRWAKAQTFSAYFQSLISSYPIDGAAIAKKYDSDFGAEGSGNATLDSLAKSARYLAINSETSELRKARRTRLIEYVRNKMVEGQIAALGRTAIDGGLDTIVALKDEYWIGAEINPEDSTVIVGHQTVDMVRVVTPEPSLVRKKGRRGPTSKSELRRSVVLACCTDNPNLLSESPAVRIRTYKRYIEKNHNQVDLRRGFSPSAFQEDEQYLRDNSMI